MDDPTVGPTLTPGTLMGSGQSPRLLQICREPLKDGCEEAYESIEREIARACAELGCPHAHVALQSLSGPKEVWWLNPFDSEAHRAEVVERFAANLPLMASLQHHGARKAALTRDPIDIVTKYRPDLSADHILTLARARFLVAGVTKDASNVEGAVYEAPDGMLYALQAVATRAEADALGRRLGAAILAVQPAWGLPAREWTIADPAFWAPNPTMRGR